MTSSTMRAVLLRSPGALETKPLSMEHIPVPDPGPGELLVRVLACGVCRSNLHMIEGDWVPIGVPAKSPIVPGHEVVGRIESLGPNVTGFDVGDRVGITPFRKLCGSCRYCISGREQLCSGPKEITGETVDGGYAEYTIANASYAYHLPEGIPDAAAAPLLCPGLTAAGSVAKVRPGPGQRVAVFGVGGVGHVVMQLVRLGGAEVVAVDTNPRHLALATQLGASAVVDASTEDPGEVLRAAGGVDAAMVCVPSTEAIHHALYATNPGGTIVVAAYGDVGHFKFVEEKTVVGSVLGTRQQMIDLLALAGQGLVRATVEPFSLSDATEALRRLKCGELTARAVLIP